MNRRIWPAALLAMTVAACGDDNGGTQVNTPDLSRADVAGQYVMTALTFDPQGSALGETDLLARLDQSDLPDLIVSSTKDSLQLDFLDPKDELRRLVAGSYELGDDGITVQFSNAVEPGMLLFPQVIGLEFDEGSETLSLAGTIAADTARLFALVPEWSDEPVIDPLPGTLEVVFQRD